MLSPQIKPLGALGLLCGLALLAQTNQVAAGPAVFTLDPANSFLALSGSVTLPLGLGVVSFAEQGPGSLTTHYSGTVLLDLTPPTIQFPGGSSIVAQTNGVWQPAGGGVAGSAPADYGAEIPISLGVFGNGTALAAGRNINLDITSLALTLTNSGFDASRLNILFLANTPPVPVLDFRITGTGFVPNTNTTTLLTGSLTNGPSLAYLTNTAGVLKLVIPVNVTNMTSFNSTNDTTMILKGQLVATTAPEGCVLTVASTNAVFAAKGGTNTVAVTEQGGCAWTVVNTNTWISILSGGGGTNSGVVRYSVAANTNLPYRVGSMAIAGQEFTVLQRGTDTKPPTLSIKAPTPNQRWTNAVFTAKGAALDNRGVTNVWYQLNDSAWTNAITTNHWTNWTATLTLTPGTNVLRAYAWDISANASKTNTVRFSYVVTNALRLQIVGSGTVRGATNGQVIEIGRNYTLTAVPGAGSLFSNWSGSITATTNPLAFAMQSNTWLQANFVTNPFLAAKGTYNGLFAHTNRAQESSGSFSLAVSGSGAYSGSLKRGADKYSFTGQFDVAGQSSTVVSRPRTNAWVVAMGLDFDAQQLGGWVSNGVSGGWVADLLADRAVFDARTNPAAQYAGNYTVRIPGNTNEDGTVWLGDGYLTLSVDGGGKMAYSGSLADGTSVGPGSAPVCREGYTPLYVPLYNGTGSVWSWLGFDTNQPSTGLQGWLSWIKPAQAGAYYPGGLTNEVIAQGARYRPPTNITNRVIELTNGVVIFAGGKLGVPLTNAVMLTASNKVIDLSLTNKLNLLLKVSNGTFTGGVTEPGLMRSNLFRGVLLQDENGGYGYFLETNRSGQVLFWPAP